MVKPAPVCLPRLVALLGILPRKSVQPPPSTVITAAEAQNKLAIRNTRDRRVSANHTA
ncbi:MAG: hypothetical protein ACLR8Y_00030 [Alistipes indistinctus]